MLAAQPGVPWLSVTQNDNMNDCMAPAELAILKEEGGQRAGPQLRVINASRTIIAGIWVAFFQEGQLIVSSREQEVMVNGNALLPEDISTIIAKFSSSTYGGAQGGGAPGLWGTALGDDVLRGVVETQNL